MNKNEIRILALIKYRQKIWAMSIFIAVVVSVLINFIISLKLLYPWWCYMFSGLFLFLIIVWPIRFLVMRKETWVISYLNYELEHWHNERRQRNEFRRQKLEFLGYSQYLKDEWLHELRFLQSDNLSLVRWRPVDGPQDFQHNITNMSLEIEKAKYRVLGKFHIFVKRYSGMLDNLPLPELEKLDLDIINEAARANIFFTSNLGRPEYSVLGLAQKAMLQYHHFLSNIPEVAAKLIDLELKKYVREASGKIESLQE